MAALVIDGGSWYQRRSGKLQTAADAAALAGAQELPLERRRCAAGRRASDYAQHELLRHPALTVTFRPIPSTMRSLSLRRRSTPGIFAPVLGAAFDDVTVHAEARQAVFAPVQLKNVAPIAIHKDYACIVTDPGCFGQTMTLDFVEDDRRSIRRRASSACSTSTATVHGAGAGDMKDWLENGYPDSLPINTDYPARERGEERHQEAARGRGRRSSGAAVPRLRLPPAPDGYHVIGWAAFVIDEVVKWGGRTPGNHVIKATS